MLTRLKVKQRTITLKGRRLAMCNKGLQLQKDFLSNDFKNMGSGVGKMSQW